VGQGDQGRQHHRELNVRFRLSKETLVSRLTSRLVDACLVALPARVGDREIDAARQCLVDSLAAAHAAYGERPIELLRELTTAGASGPATVIGYGESARPADAALVNGAMISLQLFDDNQAQMRGHPSGPLLPAVLALAELKDASVRAALQAFVVGYEIECRLGTILNPSHYETGWHATATQGSFAAVVASGLLLGLDAAAMAHALGIAASMAGGLRRNFGTMTMSLHSGLAAGNGVRAAQLAERGFTASPDIFDGAMGVGAVFSREWSDGMLEESLGHWGEPFMIVSPGPTFKLYPCGRPPLFAVDCVVLLQRRHGIAPADIRRIRCDVSYMYPRTLIHSRPENGLQGKTSLEYCVAASFVDGHPTLASFTDAAVRREATMRLIELTEVRVPPHLSEEVAAVRKAPFEQPVTVEVTLADGRVLAETVAIHKGSPENPATDEDLMQKFIDCTVPQLGEVRAREALACLRREDVSVRELMQCMKVKP
jgi:2-methylcitrate dehydratase PrpD